MHGPLRLRRPLQAPAIQAVGPTATRRSLYFLETNVVMGGGQRRIRLLAPKMYRSEHSRGTPDANRARAALTWPDRVPNLKLGTKRSDEMAAEPASRRAPSGRGLSA